MSKDKPEFVLFIPLEWTGFVCCYQNKDSETGEYYFSPIITIATLYNMDDIIAVWRITKFHLPFIRSIFIDEPKPIHLK